MKTLIIIDGEARYADVYPLGQCARIAWIEFATAIGASIEFKPSDGRIWEVKR